MAAMELTQHLKLTQQLVMTPQLQQAIKLLQLSRIELVDVLRQELEENPVLEETADASERSATDGPRDADQAEPAAEITSKPTENEAMSGAAEVDWEKYLENYANQAPTPSLRPTSDDLPSLEATLGSKTTLADHLRWQLKMTVVTDEEERFIDLVVGNLDPNGYFKEPPIEELAAEAGDWCAGRSARSGAALGPGAYHVRSRQYRPTGTGTDEISVRAEDWPLGGNPCLKFS